MPMPYRVGTLFILAALAGCSTTVQRGPVAATSSDEIEPMPPRVEPRATPTGIVNAGHSSSPTSRPAGTDGFPDSPAPVFTAHGSSNTTNSSAQATSYRRPGPIGSTTSGFDTPDDGLGWYSGTFEESLASATPPADAQGSANLSQVTTTFDGADFDPVISRDGSFMVFASTQHRPTADIYLKRMGSSVLTQITSDPAHDMMPSISPDGQWIAFTSNRSGNWDIYVMPITGGKALQLTTDAAADLHPSFSPDGQSLVFCRYGQASHRWELWVLDMRTPTLSFFIGEGLFPEWCPIAGTGQNGSDRIVYQRARERGSRAFGVWTIDYGRGEATNPMLIASAPDHAFINPTWSPDAKWIAFASVPSDADWAERGAPRPSNADLVLASVEGGNRVPLTSGRGVDLMPTFAPDGSLLFISDRSGHDNVWMMTTHEAIQTASGRVPMGTPVYTQAGEDDGH
ncbi:MAG: PD40 domain-containing protein [Phycisphaerales bacterium]|nr:PD40 domain-containing protein [Phycisphaerales bacterium]